MTPTATTLRLVPHLTQVRRIAHVMRKMNRVPPHIDFDDLVQVGYLAVMAAERTWDPARGPLDNYAYRRIAGAMTDWICGHDPSSRGAFRTEAKAHLRRRWVDLSVNDAGLAYAVLGTDHDPFLRERLLSALRELPERERFAIVEHVLKARELRDIGRDLGVNTSRASQLKQAGLRRLRVSLAAVV